MIGKKNLAMHYNKKENQWYVYHKGKMLKAEQVVPRGYAFVVDNTNVIYVGFRKPKSLTEILARGNFKKNN